MRINDDTLLAYVDGQLSAQESAALERAIGVDDALAALLEEMLQTPELAEKTFEAARSENVSPELADRIWSDSLDVSEPVIPTLDTPSSNIAYLAAQQALPLETTSCTNQQPVNAEPMFPKRPWLGLKRGLLSLTLLTTGLALGVLYQQPIQHAMQHYMEYQGLAVSVPLIDRPLVTGFVTPDQALYKALQSTPAYEFYYAGGSGEFVVPVLSFQALDGRYCREFEVNSGTAVSLGVACRMGTHWELQVLLAAGERAVGQMAYQAAAGYSHNALNAVLDGLWNGSALNATQESEAIAAQWFVSSRPL